eukprot:5150834-Ditylum_brightwellii.AAC.1
MAAMKTEITSMLGTELSTMVKDATKEAVEEAQNKMREYMKEELKSMMYTVNAETPQQKGGHNPTQINITPDYANRPVTPILVPYPPASYYQQTQNRNHARGKTVQGPSDTEQSSAAGAKKQ